MWDPLSFPGSCGSMCLELNFKTMFDVQRSCERKNWHQINCSQCSCSMSFDSFKKHCALHHKSSVGVHMLERDREPLLKFSKVSGFMCHLLRGGGGDFCNLLIEDTHQ